MIVADRKKFLKSAIWSKAMTGFCWLGVVPASRCALREASVKQASSVPPLRMSLKLIGREAVTVHECTNRTPMRRRVYRRSCTTCG